MHAFLDKQLIKQLCGNISEETRESLLTLILKDHSQIVLDWPSFLTYIDCDALFDAWPPFDDNNPLFNYLITLLTDDPQQESVTRAFDQLFVACLTQVKDLPQLNDTFLLQQIEDKKLFVEKEVSALFSESLHTYEHALRGNPKALLHDLTLYLAWDRVCVHLASIFDYAFTNLQDFSGINILHECLLESFQHIHNQGRTNPGFFRLLEAFYAFQMREENLQTHPESDWQLLCQSSGALKSREILIDVSYINAALLPHGRHAVIRVYTLDSPERVKASFSLATFTMEKLKRERHNWLYTLAKVDVHCLQKTQNGFLLDATLVLFDSSDT
ncbi:MAG: hypothetical protein H0X51_04980 [Parachlamydiaceae bacterium]|nr:hypothetical protein [Parachlamydiaceae bacterium]